MTDAERARRYRDKKRGGEPRVPKPCPSIAAARRHQRNGEPMCGPCEALWREHQRKMYEQRKRNQ